MGQQQMSVSVTQSIGGGGPGGASMIPKRSIEKYSKLLGLTAEQKEQALVIYSGYSAAMDSRRKAFTEAIDEVRRTSEDAGDHTVFLEKMPKIEQEHRETTKKLESDFFSDFKSILAGKQEESWGRVERARRREVGLAGGSLSGEAMDVTELAEGLKLEGDAARSLTQILDQYEMEMDRMLVAKAAKGGDSPAWSPGKPIDIEQLQEAMKKAREDGMKVRDVNREAARKIQDLLGDEQRATFANEVRKRTFPRVYRTPRVSKDLDAALKLSDLDASQREQIEQVKSTYGRDLEPVNASWAKAVEEAEASGQSGSLGGGGSRMMMSMGDDPEALKEAKKARRELDEATSKKLRTILNDSQKERLPKPDADEDGPGGGRVMMIRRGE
jgi:hypothetical protein